MQDFACRADFNTWFEMWQASLSPQQAHHACALKAELNDSATDFKFGGVLPEEPCERADPSEAVGDVDSASNAEGPPCPDPAAKEANLVRLQEQSSTAWLVLGALAGQALVVAAVLLLYLPPLRDAPEFVYDDTFAVVRNRAVLPDNPIEEVWRSDFWGFDLASPNSHKSYRPITVLTFRLDCWLHGLEGPLSAAGFRLSSACFHAVACLLVACTARHVHCTPWQSLLAAAIFAVHPVATEAVAGVANRGDVICCIFSLLAARVYPTHGGCRAGAVARLVGSLLCLVAAILAKESGTATTGVLLVYELVGFLRPGGLRHKLWRAARVGISVAVLGAVGAGRWWLQGAAMPDHGIETHLVEARGVRGLQYLHLAGVHYGLLALPHRLCLDSSGLPGVRGPEDARLVLPLLVLLAIAGLASAALREQAWGIRVGRTGLHVGGLPRLAGLAWLVLPFVPASNLLFPVGFVVAERCLYLPGVGWAIILSTLLIPARRPPLPPRLAPVLAVALLLGLGGATHYRIQEWRSGEALWRANVEACPHSYKGHFALGQGHFERESFQEDPGPSRGPCIETRPTRAA